MNIVARAITHTYKTYVEMLTSSKFYRRTLIASLLFLMGLIALPIWKILPIAETQEFIPLHYNIYFGVDRFGHFYQVFVLPAIGLALFIINTIFQAVFYHREHVLSYFFAVTTLIAELSLFASMVFIVLLNI